MNGPAADGHVVVLGMMGAGKTTLGQLLAERLGRPMLDSDDQVVARTGWTGAQLAARDGVEALHELEQQALLDALGDPVPAVIAAAASVVDSPACREALTRAATVIWLDTPVDDLVARMPTGRHRRPLDATETEALLASRVRWFAELADVRLDVPAPAPELVDQLLPQLVPTLAAELDRASTDDGEPHVGELHVGEHHLVQQLEQHLDGLIDRLDLPAKVRLLTGASHWAMAAEPAIGLRELVLADGPSGVRGVTWDERDASASLPSGSAVAASWDEELVGRLALLLAAEARRKGVDVVLGPTVNLHRSPLGGRHFECFSEDPLLTGRLGAAFVTGIQAHGVAATAKHYVANDSENDRFTLDARVGERPLRELYLAPFERMVRQAGAWVVMAAYNRVNGAFMTENPLLHEPLKGEWAFDGVVVSDWFATRSTEMAGAGGLDLAMPGPHGPWGDALVAAVQAGAVSGSAIDDKVRRLLRLAARVGALEGVGPTAPAPRAFDDRETAALLRAAAAAGMVLVRNRAESLPLDPAGLRSVAVIGPNAAVPRIQGGGSATVFPPHVVSPLDGLRRALGQDVEVVHAMGASLAVGLTPLDGTLGRDPVTGRPGLLVRWRDGGGEVIATEERHRGSLRWLDSIPAAARSVEVLSRVRVDAAGAWRFGVLGLGRFHVSLDGATVIDEVVEPDVDAFDAAVHQPPERAAVRELGEGDEVLLEVRVPVAEGAFGISLTVGVQRPLPSDDDLLAAAVHAARSADAAVVVVGTTEQVESEGFDRTTLTLPGRQDELVRAVAAANRRTIVVVNAGAPVLTPWRDEVAAVLVSWFGGQEYGDAVADVLLGVTEPGGRLPTSWPDREEDVPVLDTTPVDGILDYTEGLHVGYRAWERAGRVPAFGFGAGGGYTTWSFDGLIAPEQVAAAADLDTVTVTVAVTNTGGRPGKQVVQLYLARPDSAVERPTVWLAGFAVVRAAPGATANVEVAIERRALEHWSPDRGTWVLEPGRFEISVGSSLADRPLRTSLEVTP
jgi:beta-glucosidase